MRVTSTVREAYSSLLGTSQISLPRHCRRTLQSAASLYVPYRLVSYPLSSRLIVASTATPALITASFPSESSSSRTSSPTSLETGPSSPPPPTTFTGSSPIPDKSTHKGSHVVLAAGIICGAIGVGLLIFLWFRCQKSFRAKLASRPNWRPHSNYNSLPFSQYAIPNSLSLHLTFPVV